MSVQAQMAQMMKGVVPPNQNHCTSCGEFMKIPPLVKSPQGQYFINPDFDMVKKFHLQSTPFGGSDGTIPAGETRDFAMTVPAEENHMGDMLINELFGAFERTGGGTVEDIAVEILSMQNDKLFMNEPVYNTLLFGNAFLSYCLPCCIMVQATNSLTLRVTNNDSVDVECFFVARGRRFLPYHDPSLRSRMLAFWNSLPTTPFWLNLDDGEVEVAALATETVQMTVPGGGDFEIRRLLADLVDNGSTTPEQIDITVTEGNGRSWQLVPLSLGSFVAVCTRAIIGFPNGVYSAAQAVSCEQYSQLWKRNSRIKIVLTNNGDSAATIRLTAEGCMHYVGECPPGDSLNRIRSLEPTIGPMLINEGRMCPTNYAQVQPVPGQGLVPVTPASAPAWSPPYVQQQAAPPLGYGYGAAMGPAGAFLQGMSPQQQAQAHAQAQANAQAHAQAARRRQRPPQQGRWSQL